MGEKRNFGSMLAQGEIVASWDDDDWSAPSRLIDQVERLLNSKRAVTGYRSMLFTDGQSWWRFKGHAYANLGTSLCYWKDWWETHQFPGKQIAEDADFIKMAAQERQYCSADAGELMVATIHRENTSRRNLKSNQWIPLPEFKEIAGHSVMD